MPHLSNPLYWVTALVAGVCGGVAMEAALWIIGAGGWAKADMVVALGSLITRKRDNAFRTGLIIHLCAAIFFALVYATLMALLGFTTWPAAMMLGGGLGFVQGLIVSLGLVWVVAEQHPLEEFNEAGLAIGLSHLIGHVVYGLVVGLVISLGPA